MKQDSAFAATRLPNLYKSLTAAYGPDKGGEIFTAAEEILTKELTDVDDRGNKMIGRHIRNNILPGFSCYRAMQSCGISDAEAFEFVKRVLCETTEGMARLCKRFSTKDYTYGLVRFIIKAFMSYAYPSEGWNTIMLESSKERVRFDMTTCLYCDELKRRGALELCPAFCYTDVVSYAPLAPAVLFKRQNTLSQTGDRCDFCFERGK